MGNHPRAFNDLNASFNTWDIWASFESNTSCEKEKERIQNEAPLRLKFGHEHPDQDRNGNIVTVARSSDSHPSAKTRLDWSPEGVP
jgi:hypothetical protein